MICFGGIKMTNNKIKDERVVEQQRKIASDAFQLVSMFLLLSILYKQFILNEPFKAYMTEFIAFFGGSFYIVFGNLIKGGDIYNRTVGTKKHVLRWYLLNSLVSSLAITTVLIIQNHKKYLQSEQTSFSLFMEIMIVFLFTFSVSLLISWGLRRFSKKRLDKISKRYEEEQ
jgi:glucan phosphoethanolaminetransferase (alkaline phosphatase superfamily)